MRVTGIAALLLITLSWSCEPEVVEVPQPEERLLVLNKSEHTAMLLDVQTGETVNVARAGVLSGLVGLLFIDGCPASLPADWPAGGGR